ncbi:MAG TPA: hypothetical protein VGV18_02765 [Verrucomicrobiae bacterium]|nr:hypothetical protein [Verrucomicrobiae bacterium]
MKARDVKLRTFLLALILSLNVIPAVYAQTAAFFRISGPSTSKIVTFNESGAIVWTNSNPSGVYTVQRNSSLTAASNWADYVALPALGTVNTNQIVDFTPPHRHGFHPRWLVHDGRHAGRRR